MKSIFKSQTFTKVEKYLKEKQATKNTLKNCLVLLRSVYA